MSVHAFTSRTLFRSFLSRRGQWQHSRLMCKGTPEDPSEIKAEGKSADKQKETQTVQEAKEDGKEQQTKVSEKESSEKSVDEKRAAARKKLNDLLISLATTDTVPVEPKSKVELSKPKTKTKTVRKKEKATQEMQDDDTSLPVADEIEIEPELVAATKEVAESFGGDVKATESELLTTLRSHAAETTSEEKPATNLRELFVGMKVERSQSKPMFEKQQYSRRDRDASLPPKSSSDEVSSYKRSLAKTGRSREHVSVNLFGEKALGIFNIKEEDKDSTSVESLLTVWDAANRRELKMSVTSPPANAFVEMIQWTNQGKFWTFPIDNEVGLEEEKQIGFHQHIFLEHHLEGWCPKRGPIRHFMELVCTGLSKNPHLTVERKIRHIQWYKDYFENKKDVLMEIGAIGV